MTVIKHSTVAATTSLVDLFLKKIDSPKTRGTKTCIVMRFHGKQLIEQLYNLENSIKSIIEQNAADWELLLVPSDSSDVSKVFPLLVKYNSNQNIRLLRFADLMEYKQSEYANFHNKLYEITDQAIMHCSQSSRWLLVTNGDNFYNKKFLEHLDTNYDVIAYDFYSRWVNHLKGIPPCERMSGSATGEISCMQNLMKPGSTDLGSNVYNLKRWNREKRRFSTLKSSEASHDGEMAKQLMSDNWRLKVVGKDPEDGCLYDHNPNYHSCTSWKSSNVWDDGNHVCIDTTVTKLASLKYKSTNTDRCITTE
jgi:hypothetical protein